MRTTNTGRRIAAAATMLAFAAGTAACNDQKSAAGEPASPVASTSTSTAPPAKVVVSLADGTKDVGTASVFTVKADAGQLDSVTVASQDGKRTVVGAMNADKVWTSTGVLMPKTTYTITAKAHNASGAETSSTSSFTTVTPTTEIGYTVTPDGWTVGSGMPVQVSFDEPITSPDARAAIESRLGITVAPAQVGSWGWTSDSTLMYRPQTYWASGTSITVTAPLAGLQVAPGAYVMEDNGAKLTIGTQRVLRVDLQKHTMSLTENGAAVRTFLISGGRPGEKFETRSGTKLIQDKYADIIMDSSTFGIDKADPEYYRTKVQWAMRITDTGEFLHSAPWSVAQQGKANVSHGCVNMAPGDAQWLFNRVQYGDVVENTGSSYTLQPGEAGIPVWLWTWPQWQAKSALFGKAPVAPQPSPAGAAPATAGSTTTAPTPAASAGSLAAPSAATSAATTSH